MKLATFMAQMDQVQYRAAVYEELINHLSSCVDSGAEIPVDIQDGAVPDDIVRSVINELRAKRDVTLEKLELAEDVEVSGVKDGDFVFG